MYFSAARLSLALTLVSSLPALKAQQSGGGTSSGTFLNDYLTFLNGSGYTSLSSALQQANNSDDGRRWIDQLSSGQWTVFAPSNQAFQNANPPLPNNTETISSYLSYHYVYGNALSTKGSSDGGAAGGGAGSSSAMSMSSSTQSSSASQPSSTESDGGGGSGSSTTETSSPTASAFRFGKRFSWPHFFQSSNGGSDNGGSGNASQDFIGRTLLSDGDLVNLEGSDDDSTRKHQVLVWTNQQGQLQILNQLSGNVAVGNSSQFRNLQVANVDQVLIPPGNLTTALTAVNDQPLLTLLEQAQLPYGTDGGGNASAALVLNNLQGFTFFAPSADAFTSEFNSTLQNLQGNQSELTTIIQNHYINGSTIYSPTLIQHAQNAGSGGGNSSSGGDSGGNGQGGNATQLQSGGGGQGGNGSQSGGGSGSNSPFISAAGEPFTITQNDTGLFVSNGNGSSAQIVRPDVLVQNGVIHLIDQFLINDASSPSAAASAFASASSAATETVSDTAILGGGSLPTGSSSSGSSQSQTTSASTGGAGGAGGSSTSTDQSSSSTSSSSESQSESTSSQTSSAAGSAASGFRFARAMNRL